MSESEPGQDPEGGEDARLRALEERLKSAHRAEAVRTGTAQKKPGKGYSQGNRVLTELIAGIAGGALIGCLLGLLFLGIAVAFRNIIRISNERPK
jgi:ATP synthase protein I